MQKVIAGSSLPDFDGPLRQHSQSPRAKRPRFNGPARTAIASYADAWARATSRVRPQYVDAANALSHRIWLQLAYGMMAVYTVSSTVGSEAFLSILRSGSTFSVRVGGNTAWYDLQTLHIIDDTQSEKDEA